MNHGIFHVFEHLMQTGEVLYQEAPAAAPSRAKVSARTR